MRLQLMTWPEVEEYLKNSQGVIIPIGATEQHGPTGLIGTDAICAETLAWRAGELADAVVGPTLTVGMSEHHMHFPGSVTLRPTTLITVVRDVVLSLIRHGF
ncbi:MAG: creatininase family protein, partial [Acidobacteria bacterium]|nr:creatininase family protein [Acidobacteriota bacterium]